MLGMVFVFNLQDWSSGIKDPPKSGELPPPASTEAKTLSGKIRLMKLSFALYVKITLCHINTQSAGDKMLVFRIKLPITGI